MKNESLISVIIPIYNVAKYLPKCLDSVLAQTYKNLEIILVDDGSLDDCGKICDEYAANDSRIKVIHKKNGGVSSARNAGLDMVTGDLIAFVDPDDYIAPNMYETMLACMERTKSDIVMCGIKNVYPNEKIKISKIPQKEEFIYENPAQFFKDFVRIGVCQVGVACNKLLKREIITGNRFDENLVRAEDLNFLLDAIVKKPRITFCPQVLYFYLQRTDSAVKQRSIEYYISEYIVWKRVLEMIDDFAKQGNAVPLSTQKLIYQSFVWRISILSLLIILADDKHLYQTQLEDVCAWLKMHTQDVHIFQFTGTELSLNIFILKIFGYFLGKWPKGVIGLLRCPLIKPLARYCVVR